RRQFTPGAVWPPGNSCGEFAHGALLLVSTSSDRIDRIARIFIAMKHAAHDRILTDRHPRNRPHGYHLCNASTCLAPDAGPAHAAAVAAVTNPMAAPTAIAPPVRRQ